MSYELQVIFYCTSYRLLITYELRVTVYYTSYEWLLACELRVTFLMMRYNKDKDDKAVYDNKCVGKNYSLGLGKLRFRVISI